MVAIKTLEENIPAVEFILFDLSFYGAKSRKITDRAQALSQNAVVPPLLLADESYDISEILSKINLKLVQDL